MKKILLTGGGTAGHVMPHLALLPYLRENGFEITYIGSYKGIEKTLIEKENIPYKGINSGKLRRYFDWKNLSDIFRIFQGILQATLHIRKIKPDLVFSKGGFVSVPVVIGAYLNRVPIVIHESDMTPGLANKIALRFAQKICTTFEETLRYLPASKAVHTGSPIREAMLAGNREAGLAFTGFDGTKPVILLTGGSLGAKALNLALRESLDLLKDHYHIIHLCGKDNLDPAYDNLVFYRQYEFIGDQLPDLMALSDYVISRAGSNTITELLALYKPNILVPLGKAQSRGDQILNANAFEKAGYSLVIDEADLTSKTLLQGLETLENKKEDYIKNMKESPMGNGTQGIMAVLMATMK